MNKINVQFISKSPEKEVVWCSAIYEDAPNSEPSLVLDAAKQKPKQEIVEVFVPLKSSVQRYLLCKLGKQSNSTRKKREDAGANLLRKAVEGNQEALLVDLQKLQEEGLDIVAGMLLANWKFDKYRKGEKSALRNLFVLCEQPVELEKKFKPIANSIEGTLYARALTSEPPNIFFPLAYADALKELETLGVAVEILDTAALDRIGMRALLAVGQGSSKPPCVVVLNWNGAGKETAPIALVGKGVCFDSGGLCLKPTAQQHEMKWDKAAAGVVAGTIKALALDKAPVNVVGVIGLVENMPDGAALKPGDIVLTLSGQTVEIVNTDAEGRLVLADCLSYAQQRFRPKIIVDLGTLTMETFASLGNTYAGLYSTSETLVTDLKAAGVRSGDLLWELPMGQPFAKQIESPVADMKNVGVDFCGENGAAAEFLKRFVQEIPWAHLDISGVSWIKEDLPSCEKGVTGFGVRLLLEWLCAIDRFAIKNEDYMSINRRDYAFHIVH